MHFLIKEYIETNKSLANIFLDLKNTNQPVEEVLRILANDPTTGENIQDKIDLAIEKGHPDEEVFFLFITQLIYYFGNLKMHLKADSAYRISCAFDIGRYHTEIQSFYFQASSYYHLINRNFEKADYFNMKSLKIISNDSKRYFDTLQGVGQFLSFDGRLALMPKSEINFLVNQRNGHYYFLRILLRNALFIVDINSIDKYELEWRTKYKNQNLDSKEIIEIAIDILKGNFNERPLQTTELNHYLLYYQSLKKGNLNAARMNFKKINFVKYYSKFSKIFYFANFHHAFVTEWYEIIENLVNNREKQSYHYMLDFFIVRYFLIKNKKDLAKIYYSQLLKNCEKFKAMGRLIFEMQFAFELSAISFFELTQPNLHDQISNKNILLETEIISKREIGLDIKRIVGKSKAIIDIKKKILQFANIHRSLLVVGETGVGKEEIARTIHEESKLKDKPFLAINCGTLTDTLLQSELFGYEIGAFTGAANVRKGIFEEADEGVVFLDEFGEMSPKLQVSLLRVLENNEIRRVGGTKVRKIKCRIIAATNANIEELIAKKLFREDLYHRLKQFSIVIPPLRERKEDIPELINFFLNYQNTGQIQELTSGLVEKFTAYHWPGNIRELKNEIDHIKIFCGNKPQIEESDVEIEWLNKSAIAFENKAKVRIAPYNDNEISSEEKMHQRITQKKITPSLKRNEQIKRLFQKYKQLTRSQIAAALEISVLTAAKDLQNLCSEKFIVKKMPNNCPRTFYFEILENKNEE